MKTGIIVYSNTGNTLQAARRLQEAMKGKGQEAELLQVRAGNEKPESDVSRVRLTEKPSPEGFDRLVFASPVWGFSLSGVMKAYLAGLPPLAGKKIGLYVTHQFPLPWMGGKVADDAESYRYLAESIRMHPSQEELKTIMKTAGFGHVDIHNMTGGVVALHVGIKC